MGEAYVWLTTIDDATGKPAVRHMDGVTALNGWRLWGVGGNF